MTPSSSTIAKINEIDEFVNLTYASNFKPYSMIRSYLPDIILPGYDRVLVQLFANAPIEEFQNINYDFLPYLSTKNFEYLDLGIDFNILSSNWDLLKDPLSHCTYFNTIFNTSISPSIVVGFIKQGREELLTLPPDFSEFKHIKIFEIPNLYLLPEDVSFLKSVETYIIQEINPKLMKQYFTIPENLKRIVVSNVGFNHIADQIKDISSLERIDIYPLPHAYLRENFGLKGEDLEIFKKYYKQYFQ